MKGPLSFRFKLFGEARDFPIRAFIEIKKGGITREDIVELSKLIRQNAAHLILIITDRHPPSDVLEEIEALPQILITTVEQRDIAKLLVIALAKKRGEGIDGDLLQRAYSLMFEKFGLRGQLTKWFERMTEKGYVLDFEGFVERTVSACRFFINCIGKKLTLEECWSQSWAIRDLLPFGIDSKIIPDMGLDDLEKHARILKNYEFVEESNGKYHLKNHPSEERVKDLIERHGGVINKDILISNFIYKDANKHLFDSLLDYMERKLLISQVRRDLVQYLSLADLKKQRDETVREFEQKRALLEGGRERSFAYVLTWKEKGWSLIDIKSMENIIENFLTEISTATNEDLIRSRTFLVQELVIWYRYYIDKLTTAVSKSIELITDLKLEIGNLEQKAGKVIENLVKATKAINLKVELQELQKAKSVLEEIENFLNGFTPLEEIEEMLKSIAGGKKTRDPTRWEKLTTDIDELFKNQGIRGDWSIAKYVLIKRKVDEVKNGIQGLNAILDSLDHLSNELVSQSEKIQYCFQKLSGQQLPSEIKLTPIFIEISTKIAEGVIRKPPFPLNVNIVTVTELQKSLEEHVKMLREESGRAESLKSSIEMLIQEETSLNKQLKRAILLEKFWEEFWEDKVSVSLINERDAIYGAYNDIVKVLSTDMINLTDFEITLKKCDHIRRQIEILSEQAQKNINRFNELLDEITNYIKAGMAFVERVKKNILPKITKSDVAKINDILVDLAALYEWASTWTDASVKQIFNDASFPKIPKRRKDILDEEHKLRESLIHEIKDLEVEETLILLELLNLSSTRRYPIPITEASELIGKQVNLDQESVKKMLMSIADKGFLTLVITF